MKCSEALKYFAPEGPADAEQLHANVLMGLHAASQPLTLLRAVLWPEGLHQLTPSELRETAEASAAAVERTCVLFDLIRELVIAEGIPTSWTQFDLAATLEEIEARFTPDFDSAGIDFEVSFDSHLLSALGDPALAFRAIALALKIAKSLPDPGRRIGLSVLNTDSQHHVVIQTANVTTRVPEAETALSLALLGTLLRKQKAVCTYELNPFHLRMRFGQAQAVGRRTIP